MQLLTDILAAIKLQALNILAFPVNPNSRIYLLYLASSILLTYLIYRRTIKNRAEKQETGKSFWRFLFPKHVWSNPSAWLDIRYFFFHFMIGHFLMAGLIGVMSLMTFWKITGGVDDLLQTQDLEHGIIWNVSVSVAYMFVAIMVIDFIAYVLHYLQHKVPLLWQFHKVHHSLEVMHPISNFREHPIDNLVYNVFTGMGYGLIAGLAYNIFEFVPSMPSLIGVPILMFGFNLVGYNLRHSHVWLRWPGRLSMVFPSPAHHHVHHSCHPDHIDKNFAFIFPVWDVIFKTYTVPEDNRDVKFGLGGDQAKELTSCLKLYLIPFRDAYRLFRKPSLRDRKHEDRAQT